jgi:hypothetical protein
MGGKVEEKGIKKELIYLKRIVLARSSPMRRLHISTSYRLVHYG